MPIIKSSGVILKWLHIVVTMVFSLLLSSCIKQWEEKPSALIYSYNDSSGRDIFAANIFTMTDFVFNGNGILISINEVARNSLRRRDLTNYKAGHYTVVTWANLQSDGSSTRSEILSYEIGKTHISEMRMRVNVKGFIDGTQGNTERLFYGQVSFDLTTDKHQLINVRMTHSHMWLHILVRWRSEAPQSGLPLNMRLYGTPGTYTFLSREINFMANALPTRSITRSTMLNVPIHEPNKKVNHSLKVILKADKELNADFITYRFTNEEVPTLQIFEGDKPLTGELSLERFFSELGTDLDLNIRQEFDLTITIDDGEVTIASGVLNWEDGGTIG